MLVIPREVAEFMDPATARRMTVLRRVVRVDDGGASMLVIPRAVAESIG